ncbi:MAG: hypothetical protein WD751_07555 [Anaerolineales bacterium]
MPSNFEIFIVILAGVAAFRLFREQGTWWWAALPIVAGIALLFASGTLIGFGVPLWYGAAYAEQNLELYLIAAQVVSMGIELMVLIALIQMVMLTKKFIARPWYYAGWSFFLGLILIAALFTVTSDIAENIRVE